MARCRRACPAAQSGVVAHMGRNGFLTVAFPRNLQGSSAGFPNAPLPVAAPVYQTSAHPRRFGTNQSSSELPSKIELHNSDRQFLQSATHHRVERVKRAGGRARRAAGHPSRHARYTRLSTLRASPFHRTAKSEVAARLSHTLTQGRVIHEQFNALRQLLPVKGGKDEAVAPPRTGRAIPVDVVGDKRLGRQRSLRKRGASPSRREGWTRMSIAAVSSGTRTAAPCR